MLCCSKKFRASFDRALRVFMCLWMPLWLCSCNVSDGSLDGDDATADAQAGDPHTIIVSDNNTGESKTFHLHKDTDTDQLVFAHVEEKDSSTSAQGAEEESVSTTFAIPRSILEDVVLQNLEGNQIGLYHPERGEYHPGILELVHSTETATGDLAHLFRYQHPELGLDLHISAHSSGDKSDVNSQVGEGIATVIIVVASLAAAVCVTSLIVSAIKTDCNRACVQACGQGNVKTCKGNIGVHFSLPLNVDCTTDCEQTCRAAPATP